MSVSVNVRMLLILAAWPLVLTACATEPSPEVPPAEAPTAAAIEEPAGAEAEAPAVELPTYDPAALEVIAGLNQWRLAEGLWPFKPNETLEAMARDQAEYVLSQPSLPEGGEIHTGRQGEGPKERALAYDWPHYKTPEQMAITEIAHVGADAEAAIQWWQGSQVHHDSVVDPTYREIGVAALEHPIGYLYIVVLGARPDVLPALVEPETGRLYLSTERFRWASGGDWLAGVTEVQMLESAESAVDEAAWIPWQLFINAPEETGQPFYVVYSDGTRQVTTEVQPGIDVVWLPDNLP